MEGGEGSEVEGSEGWTGRIGRTPVTTAILHLAWRPMTILPASVLRHMYFHDRGADDGEEKKKTRTRAWRAIDEQLLRRVQ